MPTPDAVAYIHRAQEVFLSRVRAAHTRAGRPRTRVTSWQRTPQHNASVGGAPDSQHLIGTAVDLVEQSGALRRELLAVGLVVLDYPGHLHAQLWPSSAQAVKRIAPDLVIPTARA